MFFMQVFEFSFDWNKFRARDFDDLASDVLWFYWANFPATSKKFWIRSLGSFKFLYILFVGKHFEKSKQS